MNTDQYEVETKVPFSQSLIWQLNRNFYKDKGINAWSEDIVPHHMTSNSYVGKTYAELIFACLKDLAAKGNLDDIVYILELGAGHGRLGFHILKHLKKLTDPLKGRIPQFCYILSDIVEDNLTFFSEHKQFKSYFEEGILDVSYFDAVESNHLYLRKSKKKIEEKQLQQPIIAIANYFFDSIPSELYFIKDQSIFNCEVSVKYDTNPNEMNSVSLIKNMMLTFSNKKLEHPIFGDAALDNILEKYKFFNSETYIYFPKISLECLTSLKSLSNEGLVLLTMDKGFHELSELANMKEPDIVKHGSFSFWVNYHALSEFCLSQKGKVFFPRLSNFHLEMGCLLFADDANSYIETSIAYDKVVDEFGPDDFNSIKQLAYSSVAELKMMDLIVLYRLSAYDSTFFIKLLPRLKQVKQNITYKERKRLAQTLHIIWDRYFFINEQTDISYELAGLFYDLGYYSDALKYFHYSIDNFGDKMDVFYNQALCYYQLRNDEKFYVTLEKLKKLFPLSPLVESLESLDMS